MNRRHCFVLVGTVGLLFVLAAGASEKFSVSDAVNRELKAAKLSEREVRLRLKIIENVANGKTYFPHPERGRPETRNSKYWKVRGGSYVPAGSATEAIRDLWRTENGIQCYKYSSLILIKALIDVAGKDRIAELDKMLDGKVIPNDLPREGIGTLFSQPKPRNGEAFRESELIPGDQIYFKNPYYRRLTDEMRESKRGGYAGQQGYHTFYYGDGKVIDIYGGRPKSIAAFRDGMLGWDSVQDVAKKEHCTPKAEDFQIISLRRAIVN